MWPSTRQCIAPIAAPSRFERKEDERTPPDGWHAHDEFETLLERAAGLTLVKMLVTGLVLALLAGTIVKIKLFGGPQ